MSGADIKDKKRWIDSLKASKNTENYRKKASENAKKQWLLISAEERKKKMGNLRKISKSKWLYSWSRKNVKTANYLVETSISQNKKKINRKSY